MSALVDDLEWVETIIDNILVYRKTKLEHDEENSRAKKTDEGGEVSTKTNVSLVRTASNILDSI